jgi:hypothetical protein
VVGFRNPYPEGTLGLAICAGPCPITYSIILRATGPISVAVAQNLYRLAPAPPAENQHSARLPLIHRLPADHIMPHQRGLLRVGHPPVEGARPIADDRLWFSLVEGTRGNSSSAISSENMPAETCAREWRLSASQTGELALARLCDCICRAPLQHGITRDNSPSRVLWSVLPPRHDRHSGSGLITGGAASLDPPEWRDR